MMIKYRVSDVAKDFGRPNKEIAEILGDRLSSGAQKQCPGPEGAGAGCDL